MFGKPFCAAAACLLLFAALPCSACAPQESARSVYAIEAEYEDGTLRASMRFSFCNGTGEPLSALDFNLYGNAFREGALYPPVTPSSAEAAYWAGESCGEMKILSVSPCAGWEVCGEDENILRVTPEQELFPGEKAETEIVWELKLAEINHRTGISESAVNLGNFYPVLCVREEGRGFVPCAYSANGDPFYSECADYEVTFTAPASYTVAASGEAVSASVSGGRKTSVYRLENARDFALCLSENFRTAMGEACGVPVAYYYTDDADPQRSLALLEECFAWYSRKFGAYPYGSFSAAQTGFCYGGMEYPGLVFISSAAEGEELAYTLAHETAHQWWYAAVGSDQTRNAWMDEGLAEYSALLFFGEAPQYGISAEARLGAARRACDALYTVQEQVFGEADLRMSRPLADFGSYEYVVLTYDRGLLLFDTLRGAMGEKKFFSALRAYYKKYAGKIARPEELAAAFGTGGEIVESFVSGEALV